MDAATMLREGLGFGPNLTDEQVVLLVLERLADLTAENRTLKEYFEKFTLIKG